MHPYLTERMLHQSEALAPLGAIAVQHRERLDGSGYPRGLVGRGDLTAGSHPRRGGRIPGDARAASLPVCRDRRTRRPPSCEPMSGQVAWTRRPSRRSSAQPAIECTRRREGPAGLTAREVEVLQLLARGLPNKAIAERLVIAPKTVANHVEHIYLEDRRLEPRAGEPLRDAARPPSGGGVRARVVLTWS